MSIANGTGLANYCPVVGQASVLSFSLGSGDVVGSSVCIDGALGSMKPDCAVRLLLRDPLLTLFIH